MTETVIVRDFKDATESYWPVIKPRHSLHCKRMDPVHCTQANAINSDPSVLACKVYQNITYIWFKGDRLPTRYQNSAQAKFFAQLNGRKGRRAIIDEIRDEFKMNGTGVEVELQVPRKSVSKAYLRSGEMKEKRRQSAIDNRGKPKRRYEKPDQSGMRSGSGQAHLWTISK